MNALQGKRVLVTRPRRQAKVLLQKLEDCGAMPIPFPTIAVVPHPDQSRLDQALEDLSRYSWLIFTSQNGVEVFWERYTQRYADLQALQNLKVAAIGPATARLLEEHGISVRYMPEEYIAEAVAEGIGDVQGQSILLPRAEVARPTLVTELSRRGAAVDEIPIYQTLPAEPAPQAWEELERGFDFVTFTSSSTVRSFFDLLYRRLGEDRTHAILESVLIACIGPITAATVEEYGCRPAIVAGEYTTAGLVKAMKEYGGD